MYMSVLHIFKPPRIEHNPTHSSEMDAMIIFFVIANLIIGMTISQFSGNFIYDLHTIHDIFFTGIILSLLLRENWLNSKKLQNFLWSLSVIGLLIVPASYYLWLSNFSIFWIIILTAAIMLISLLLSTNIWPILTLVGISVGFLGKIFAMQHSSANNIIYINEMIIAPTIFIVILFGFLILTDHKNYVLNDRIKSVSTFSAAIVHEVITPLAAIEMTMDIIQNKEHNDLIQEALILTRTIRQDIDIILHNLREIDTSVDRDEQSLKEIIYKTLDEYHMNTVQRNNITVEIKNNILFYGSNKLMKYTIFNLLKNAFQHCGPDVEITLIIHKNRLIFKDNGPGMSTSKAAKILNTYHNNNFQGLGIGLAFCHAVMKQIGGEMICRSITNQGTEFILSFAPSAIIIIHEV